MADKEKLNEYQKSKINFQGGTRAEKTFDPNIGKWGGHTCCQSRAWWRHKVSCPRLGWGKL